jgi:hypothetical protein
MTNIGALISRQAEIQILFGRARPQLVFSLGDLDRSRLVKDSPKRMRGRTVRNPAQQLADPRLSLPSTESLNSTLAGQTGLAFGTLLPLGAIPD